LAAGPDRAELTAALQRVAAGDAAAVRLLYDRTAPRLFALCLRILGDEGEAGEVVQDTYLTAWRKAGSYDPARDPLVWLAALTRTHAIDRQRAAGTGRTPARPGPSAPLVQTAFSAGATYAALARRLGEEPEVVRARIRAELSGVGDDPAELTAAEYVLGVLETAENTLARRRAASEAGFAARVEAWEDRLVPMVGDIPEVRPPAGLWRGVEDSLHPVTQAVARGGVWDSVVFWRGAAVAAATFAAVCLALVFLVRGEKPRPPPWSAAALTAPATGAVLFTVAFDEGARRVLVTPTGPGRPQNRSPELWLVRVGEPPLSLGILPNRPLTLKAPRSLAARSLLQVSLEPFGGSPSGRPTGPVVAAGRLARP
jgi:anti-sigma-K factor RskA